MFREKAFGTSALLALAWLSLLACTGESPSGDRRGGPVPTVEAVEAQRGALPLVERLSGVVRAENQVTIYPRVSAPVEEVLARSGQTVQKGQVLVRLDDAALRDQLRQAEANVELSEAAALEADARVQELDAQVSRTRALHAQELVSQIELETQEARLQAAQAGAAQARARVSQARATVDERRSRLQETVVRAPIAGRIGQMHAEVGMRVDGTTELCVMGNLDRLIVEVPLTEGMLAYVEEGMPVRVTSSALGDVAAEATLTRVSPFLQTDSFSTVGEIDLDNRAGRLQPGMFVTVDVLYGASQTATLVPTSALWEDPSTGLLGVYSISGYGDRVVVPAANEGVSDETWRVAFQPVEVLARGRESVGIDGIEEGTWVVSFGQNLFDGGSEEQRARVRPTTWDEVVGLQSLQREDLLHGFLEKQQRMAREHGAEPPSRDSYLAAARDGDSPDASNATVASTANAGDTP